MTSEEQSDRLRVWNQKWEDGSIQNYYLDTPRQQLHELYDHYIQEKECAKILVPLCGDSDDLKILADKGHEIVGIECSEIGIKAFLKKHDLDYTQEPCRQVNGSLFKSKDGCYRFYCCDIFNFSASAEGQFDVILDFGFKGALLPSDFQMYADLMNGLLKDDGKHIVEFFSYDFEKYPDARLVFLTFEQTQKMYGDRCQVKFLTEGPNPYENVVGQGEDDTENRDVSSDQIPCSAVTAAIYYLITWK